MIFMSQRGRHPDIFSFFVYFKNLHRLKTTDLLKFLQLIKKCVCEITFRKKSKERNN